MDNFKSLFIANNLKYLPKSKQKIVLEMLDKADENRMNLLYGMEFKKPTNWLLFYWFVPLGFIVDRLFMGQILLGLLKIIIYFFSIFIGIGESNIYGVFLLMIKFIVEAILTSTTVKYINYRKVKKILNK